MKNCSYDIADWQRKMFKFQNILLGEKRFIEKQCLGERILIDEMDYIYNCAYILIQLCRNRTLHKVTTA